MKSLHLLLATGVLMVDNTTAFSFTAPHRHVVSRLLTHQIVPTISIQSRRGEATRAREILSSTSTSTAEVTDNLANIHSLNSITSNPHLFPVTSDYIHSLSRLKFDDSDRGGPSAAEFLNQLSREILLLSQNNNVPVIEHSSTSARSDEITARDMDSYQPSYYHSVEVTAPAFTSAFGVGVAAQMYEPALYSQYINPMMMASQDGSGRSNVLDNTAWYGHPSLSSAAIDNRDVVESFASWHKHQGGSNALRDLALSIPTDDVNQVSTMQDMTYIPPEQDHYVTSMHDYWTPSTGGFDSNTVANTFTSYNHLGERDEPSYSSSPIYDQRGETFTDDISGSNYAWDSIGDQGYYYQDTTPVSIEGGSAMEAIDQVSRLPEVNYELSNSLTSELSNLKYDDITSPPPTMHNNGGVLSDIIMSKLDQLDLPHYHLELPMMTNPLSEVSPSMQNALLSIKKASDASRGQLDSYLNSVTHSFDGLNANAGDASKLFENFSGQMSKVADAGASGLKTVGNALQMGASNIANLDHGTPTLPNMDIHLPTIPNFNVIEGASAAMHHIGETSLSDVGNVILTTIELTGGIIINFLDLLLNAIVGTNFASVVGNAQSAISSLVANASHFVLSTVSNIGNMSVVEIVQHLLTLVIAITDILLKVMNAIIYLLSGSDGVTWALLATSSVKEASSQLLAQTSSIYHDFTHASLTELANSFGDYGQVVGNELLALIGSLESVVDKNSFDGISIPDDMFESAVTVLQTGLSF